MAENTYMGSDENDNVIKNQYTLKINPLISNRAIFTLNDYIKDNGGKPLSVSRCKYIRDNILQSIYDEQLNKAFERAKGENLGNESLSDVADSGIYPIVTEVYGDKENGISGKLEQYIDEHNLLPKNRKQSFAEYAMAEESLKDYSDTLSRMNRNISNNKVIIDIFKKYKTKTKTKNKTENKTFDLADTSTIQRLLEEEPKQTKLFDLDKFSKEEKADFYKEYKPFKLTKDIALICDYECKNRNEKITFLDNLTKAEVCKINGDNVEPLNKNYPEMNLYTYDDVYHLYNFRKYISKERYDDIAKNIKMVNKEGYYIAKADVRVDQQSINNGLAICEELERRGLPFEIECEAPGKLSAKIDLGAKQRLDVRIYDYEEPQYIGRVYSKGSFTYFSNSKKENGENVRYEAKEKDVLALLKYGLGERPDTALVNNNGEAYQIGFNDKDFDNKYNRLKNNETRNNNFHASNNTNILYDMDGYYPVYIHTENPRDYVRDNELKFEDSESAKEYISDTIEQAKLNYKFNILGSNFYNATNAENVEFEELLNDEDATIQQNKYLKYLRNDEVLLQGVNETNEEFKERQELFNKKLKGLDNEDSEKSVDEILTFEQKKAVVLNHIDELAEHNFGKVKNNVIKMNFSNVAKYSGMHFSELATVIKKCENVDIDYMRTEEYSMNHVSERMIKFDEKSSKSMLNNKELSPFMSHVKDTVVDSLEAQGFDLSSLRIDDNGIICYEGNIVNKTKYKNDEGPDTTSIKGYIGQVFEPDDKGVICTKYNSTENKAIIPKYMATVERIDYENEKSMEERTKCIGYTERLDRSLKYAIHDNFVRNSHDAYNSETSINSLYRDLYADKLPLDYMTDFRAKGMDDELSDAIIKSKNKTIRYITEYRDNSTLNTWYSLGKSNVINDICSDAYAKTAEDISIVSDCVACDNTVTGNAYNQGIIRYMREHAEIDDKGHLIPPKNEKGDIDEKDRMPLVNLNELRFLDNNPPDRQVMVVGNAMDCLHFDKKTNIAHITLQGWNMDDAYVISKEYAERNLVPSHDIEETEKLEPRVIQKHICSDDGFLKTNITETGEEYVSFYGRNYSLEEVNKRFNAEDNSKSKQEICAEYIKEELIKNNIGLRPLMAGDKLCDLGGNKGVISLVVDREMSKSEAERLELDYVCDVFKENPELEVVGAPFTAPSRMNAGTVREMMENARPLNLPNGKVFKGGMGTVNMIVTDKLVDEKSHIYDDDSYASGKGRNASSQWAWQMHCKNADNFMGLVFGNNEKNINKVRERLITLGYDWDSDYKPVKGYSPKYKNVIAHNGEEIAIVEKRDIIEIDYPSNLAYVDKENNRKATNYERINQSLNKFRNDISKKGGFIRIPFELTLKSGEKTIKADDEKGGYLLPILPPQMRLDESFDDGSKITHDFNSKYVAIARAALQYETSKIRSDEAERVLKAKSNNETNITSDIIPIQVKDKNGNVANRSAADIKNRYYNDEIKEQSDLIKKAQSIYNEYADDIHSTYFKGKKNVFKTEIMNKSLPDSATAVWSPDPRCNIDECLMNDEMMKKLHLKEGDPTMVWRDPLLRPEGVAVMKVRKAFVDNPIVGVAVNPAIDKRFDGDYDGDSVAIVSLSNEKFKKEIQNKENYINYLNKRIEKENKKENPNLDKINKWVTKLEKAEAKLADTKDNLNTFNIARDEVIEKFSVKNSLADLAQTPDDPQTIDDVHFALNTGLDIASVKGMLEEEGKLDYKVTVDNQEYKLLELEDLAKQDYINGNIDGAFDKMNTYVKTMTSMAKASDYNDYSSIENYYDCQNRMIVDHKAKGKIKSMIECSKYANHKISFKLDGDDKSYTGNEMLDYLKKDKNAVFRVNTEKGAIIDLGEEPPIRANIDNPNLTSEQREELIARKDEMKDMIKQVMEATAIKTQGTGLAGAVSQKGIKLTRDNAALNTLEITYGATQGILQAKHDAKQAKQLYTILQDTLPTLLNGYPIKEDPELGWIPDENQKEELISKNKHISKDEFIEQYYNLCNSSTGLNYEIRRERIEKLADVMYADDKFYSLYNEEKVAVLDKVTYNSRDSLAAYDRATKDDRSLFDTNKVSQFLANKDITNYDYSQVLAENHKNKTVQEISDELNQLKAKTDNQTKAEAVNIEQKAIREQKTDSDFDKLIGKYIELQQKHYDKYEYEFDKIIKENKQVEFCRYSNKNKLIPVNMKSFNDMSAVEKNALIELLDRENILMFTKDRDNNSTFERVKPIKDAYNDENNFKSDGRFYVEKMDETSFRIAAENKAIDILKQQEENSQIKGQLLYKSKTLNYMNKGVNSNDSISLASGEMVRADKINSNNAAVKYSDLSVKKQQELKQILTNSVNEDSKRILVLGPTPEQLYGTVPDTNTKSKYANLNRQVVAHINKLYEDGYREFVTIATPGYNKLVYDAVDNLKKQHPNEIRNVVLTEADGNNKNSVSVQKMLNADTTDKVIDVNKYKGMDEVIKQCKNISIVYPEKDNWKKNRKDDTLAHFIKVVNDAKRNLKMPDIDMSNTIAYKKCVQEENKNAVAENKALVEAISNTNDKDKQYV